MGMPANERMDWLVEKATELGVPPASSPDDRTQRRASSTASAPTKSAPHWHSIATAGCEQCGRNRVPRVHEAVALQAWLASVRAKPVEATGSRLLLSLVPGAQPLSQAAAGTGPVTLLSGPEGGLSLVEEQAALAAGFVPVNLGPRVLRAETAPLAVLAALTLA
jgi:16S rRNA (uracil1498-N3)-methyltransferase